MAIGIKTALPMLAVTDLDEARTFYGRVLGLEAVEDSGLEDVGAVYRTSAGTQLLVYARPTPSGSTATVCALEVEDVRAAVEALRRKGVKFEEYDLPEQGIKSVDGVVSRYDFDTAYFQDPFGNLLVLDDSQAIKARRERGLGPISSQTDLRQ